jgi:cytochrome c oxidase subunit III
VSARAYAAAERRRGQPTAWWGMAIVIASEGTLFAAMIATYWYLRVNSDAWPQGGLPAPSLTGPVVAAVVLALSAAPMLVASRAARRGGVAAARVGLIVALLLQAGYLAYQVGAYRNDLDRFDAGRNAYSSIYYTLLATDHVHVAVGILLVLWLLWKLRRGLSTYRANAAVAIAWYWYFVVLATAAVTATVVSPAL